MAKTVLITGTSSGLGRATANLFIRKGWNVVATMRSPQEEHGLDNAENMIVAKLDVRDVDSIYVAVDAGVARFGRIDALINNAGYGAYGPLETTSVETIRRQFDVNVMGLLFTTRAVLPHFRANRSGTIVNISSIGGRISFPLGTLYHGTKFAVEGLSEALQYELAPIGIRMKVVEPGLIRTEFGGRSLEFSNDPELIEYQPTVQRVMGAFGQMMERASIPEQSAEVAYQAATDESQRLRIEAGPDATQILELRRATDDDTFFSNVKALFELEH